MDQEKVWDRIAKPWKGFRNYEVSHVLEFLEGKSGKILDLGCGSGRNFVEKKGLDFYGVDFSKKMVALARERGIAREVKKGDVSSVPYDDGFFDYVIFNAVLHSVDSKKKRKKGLGEVYRVLKSGGEAVISVWGEKGCKRLGKGVKEGFASWSVDGGKLERYTYIYEAEELRRDLENVGFEVLDLEEGWNIVVIVRKK